MDGFLSYAFLQRALVMAVLSGAVCGGMGVFVVLWRMSLAGICISHAAFAGALLGLWAGVPPLPAGLAAGVGAAALSGPLAERPGFSPDTALGVIFSIVMSVAMLALGMLPGARSEGLGLIWGSLLTTTNRDIALMALAGLALLLFVTLFYKEIAAMLVQRKSAEASGVPVKALHFAALVLLGLVVAFALRAIGGLLIYSLIVTPAATALQLTWSLRNMFLLSAGFGAAASVAGIWISYHLDVPTGAAIVLCSALFLAAAMLFSPKKHGA